MSDLQANLETYHLQLQQVDAALISDPTNDELLKLKVDLSEVIELTKDLLAQQGPSSMEAEDEASCSKNWKVGDKCMAPWSQDGQYYEAVIEELHSDGKVSIGFTEYSQGDITEVAKLKPFDGHSSPSKSTAGSSGASGSAKRLPNKESLAESHQNHPADDGQSNVGGDGSPTNHENRNCDDDDDVDGGDEDMARTRNKSSEQASNKPPSLLEISPFQINPPHNKHKSSECRVKNQNSNEKTKNNNIPSLLSLEITPQEKPEPVSLLSLNFEPPHRPPLASLVNPRLVSSSSAGSSGNRNTQGRNGHIPSLFECDVMGMADTAAAHPLLITPPMRQMLVPGTFPSNLASQQFSRAASLDSSIPPRPNARQSTIPSLLSPELSLMGCEPPDRITVVPRTSMHNPRGGRRKYCFNCYGYDHTAAGCSNPKNYFKRQWLQDGMK